MNKWIKIGLILIIIVILIISYYSLNLNFKSKDDEGKFVGNWNTGYSSIIFYSNGTGNMSDDTSFSWEINNGQLTLKIKYDNKVRNYSYNYTFTDNYEKLILTEKNTGFTQYLIKESFDYLHLKTGDSIDIKGKIDGITYVSSNYGDFPIIYFDGGNFNKFMEINLFDTDIYNNENYIELKIYGDLNDKYQEHDNIIFTLHFDEMEFNGAKFLWAKEFGLYLESISAISEAIDTSSYFTGFYLKLLSKTNEQSSFEVYTTNEDQYPFNTFNISFKKMSYTIVFQENVVFSTLLNNLLNIIGNEYDNISYYYLDAEKIDFMNPLNDGISQNRFIEFIDKNSNGLIDDHDIFNLSIPQTDSDAKLETYLLTIGIDDDGNYNDIASGCKYMINWYDGIYEQPLEKELIALNYTSHRHNGTLIDTTLRISRVNSNANLSLNKFRLNLIYNKSHLGGTLKRGNIICEDKIYVDFIDSNINGLLDVDDLFLINGLENKESVDFRIENNQLDNVAYYPFTVGEGYSRNI